ncbi:hypothetical protein B0F90DRAFT_1817001 [Multifurca ochricompacta]|uniref:F-box domain-containing protein n=1 Tax=Multifurca ochricompacta TaxID=376703 RepID=A0AAD4M4G7_9AGAM|nr:hypothetical protein B0F90DRAFT_1817001 [Multifurca ochricompacta]
MVGTQASSTILPSSDIDIPNPICGLPVEILQRIFIYCAQPRSRDQPPFLQVYPEWIPITYVCRYWRAVSLNHHSLWGSITPNLSPAWIKIFMERSSPALVDVELRVGQATVKRIFLCVDEAIALLADCTRLRSMALVGPRRDVCAVLDVLRSTTPIRSLTLSLWETGPPIVLPANLFGGRAPIRHIHFTADRCIVAPRWLLHGVTHFTSGEQIPLLHLLDALSQMPTLTHFTLQHCRADWEDTDAPREPLIQMPHLTHFVVHADSPRFFVLLNQRLELPKNAKRRLELRTLAVSGWDRWARWFATLPPIIEAANGLQHVYLSGGAKEGTFRTWTGDSATTSEDAEFCFKVYWSGSPITQMVLFDTNLTSPIFHIAPLFDLLRATTCVRNLALEGDPACFQLPKPFWWELLEKLPAVEDLNLHQGAVKVLYSAWDHGSAPAVLPALRRVYVAEGGFTKPGVTSTTREVHRGRGTAVRRGFISRIVPSKVAWSGSPARTTTCAPSSYRIDDSPPLVVDLPVIHSGDVPEDLMKLLQGGGRQNRV